MSKHSMLLLSTFERNMMKVTGDDNDCVTIWFAKLSYHELWVPCEGARSPLGDLKESDGFPFAVKKKNTNAIIAKLESFPYSKIWFPLRKMWLVYHNEGHGYTPGALQN